jgi:hypothetical protein
LLLAGAIAVFLWKKTGSPLNGLASSILLGGIILGGIGFVGGFFGPIIFYPEVNLGPLIGIFYSGPIGFVVGLVAGGVYWLIKKSSSRKPAFYRQPMIESLSLMINIFLASFKAIHGLRYKTC